MKHCYRFLAALCALAAAISLFPFPLSSAAAAVPSAPLNGMLVRSFGNADFPSAPNLSAKELRRQLDELCDYAAQAGYNAVFFEARPEGDALYASKVFPTSRYQVRKQGDFTFFDPLKEMIRAASQRGLTVYAVVDPYSLGAEARLSPSHPAAKDKSLALPIGESRVLDPSLEQTIRLNADDLGALAQKYDVAGVILQNVFFTDGLERHAEALTREVGAALHGRAALGLMLPDRERLDGYAPAAAHADLLLPAISEPVGFDGDGFGERLAAWRELADGRMLVPHFDVAPVGSFSGVPSAQSFFAREMGVPARLVGGYSALRSGDSAQGDLMASVAAPSDTRFTPLDYAPAPELAVTRPASALTTTLSSYFITGTSDPSRPLTLDGEEVDRQTDDGVFGALVRLSAETNTFTFRQGEAVETVTIRRSSGASAPSAITRVTSMAPAASALAYRGEALEVSCVAPSGAAVTASVGGESVSLAQATDAAKGLPATFTGRLTLTGAADGAVQRIGPVTYTLNGAAAYPSSGSIYLVGAGARPMARVNEHAVSVFPDSSLTEGDFRAVYKEGTVERIVSQTASAYELASGGFIRKSSVEVQEAAAPPAPLRLTAIQSEHTARAEQFLLRGAAGLGYLFEDGEDGTVTLTLFGDGLALPEQIDTQSGLFSSMEWNQSGENALTCRMTPIDARKIWGVDVFYRGGDTVLYLKPAPTLSGRAGRPLEGIRVVLDPGHGGNDPGAPSILGPGAPDEQSLNLANAIMLKRRLEQLGAEVIMTRQSGDETLTLLERMEISAGALPDFFIALHHNSVAESSDGARAQGVEAYYYEPFGRELGEAVIRHISQETDDRPLRGNEWSYYTVTRMRYAPSILAEIAFMPNPAEYRRACDTVEIYKTANAIAAALLERIAAAV